MTIPFWLLIVFYSVVGTVSMRVAYLEDWSRRGGLSIEVLLLSILWPVWLPLYVVVLLLRGITEK